MATFTNPAEIARETLKLLLARRMPPTPDNYRAIYNEIAELGDADAPTPEREFKALLLALPKETPAQQGLARQLESALRGENWEDYRKTLSDFVREHSAESEADWGELIGDLLRLWEAKQSGLTPARKREMLDRVLSSGSKNAELLHGRLQGLTRAWGQYDPAASDTQFSEGSPEDSALTASAILAPGNGAAPAARNGEHILLVPELRDLLAFTLDTAIANQLEESPELATEARNIAVAVRQAMSPAAVQDALAATKRLVFKLELLAEDRGELRSALLKLLQLMLENVSELVVDDRWMNGQIAVVRDIVAKPMNIRTLNEAESRLKEVIFKQSQLKHSLMEAKEALKTMLAGFIDHLAEFADSTSGYHDKIEVCVQKISQADDITQLEDVLAEVIRETRIVQLNAQRSRDDMRSTQTRVEAAERRVRELHDELDKASALVRHDQLTGTLNRRGLEEAFEHEFARALRRRSPLCVGLLDIDNFKKLNDTLGHDAGDAALIHLATVIRDTLRPQDTLARFGGEEFVVLLPDTALDNAVTALVRLQRELTRRFFLHDNEKLLITFSAGVTDYRAGDTQTTLTKRADEAMYTAKKTGKNRVVSA